LDEASSRSVKGGGVTTHISTTESSDEGSSWYEGGGAVRQRLELPTSCMRERGVVQWRLELPTSWRKGGGAVRLEGEANLL
jgi:hypothetical protein